MEQVCKACGQPAIKYFSFEYCSGISRRRKRGNMPRYSRDIKDLLYEENIRAMLKAANRKEDSVLICLLWLTGARPGEIVQIRRSDIFHNSEKVEITIKTEKLGKGKEFFVESRTLAFTRSLGLDSNIYLEILINYAESLPQEAKLLGYTTRWVEARINKLSLEALNKKLCPYHFRHSVMTWLAKNGATAPEIKHFKGAKTLSSVEPYLAAVPYVIKMENQRRSMSEAGKEIGATQEA